MSISLVENHSRLVEWAVVLPFVGMASPVTRPGPLREVLAVIQAGLSGSVAGHVYSFAALGCLAHRVTDPAASALLALAGCSTQRVLCASRGLKPWVAF